MLPMHSALGLPLNSNVLFKHLEDSYGGILTAQESKGMKLVATWDEFTQDCVAALEITSQNNLMAFLGDINKKEWSSLMGRRQQDYVNT